MLLKDKQAQSGFSNSLCANKHSLPRCDERCETTRNIGPNKRCCEQGLLELQSTDLFKRCFFDVCPDAPGLHIIGGESLDKNQKGIYSFTGTGVRLCEALARAKGEASEIAALRANGYKRAVGLGASNSRDSAVCHGIYELIEHDAMALWWFGARLPPELILPPALHASIDEYISKLRRRECKRKHLLLDISCDTHVPAVAAVSFDEDGHCFSLGSAARASFSEAITAALREMCQMEYAHHLTRAKLQQRGYIELCDQEKDNIHRATVIKKTLFNNYIGPASLPTALSLPDNSVALCGYLKTQGIDMNTPTA